MDVAKGYGTGLLVSRASYEAEKSILRHILEGKEAVTPLMERVPGELMEKLTSGQRAATRMILETSDRFTVVQGYAGVGKTTQFRAVMSAVNMLPERASPCRWAGAHAPCGRGDAQCRRGCADTGVFSA